MNLQTRSNHAKRNEKGSLRMLPEPDVDTIYNPADNMGSKKQTGLFKMK